MFDIDGNVYLAYSGTFAKDAPQTRLLKRAWESLRRSAEFRRDCQLVTTSEPADLPRRQEKLKKKWGVALADPTQSFDDIIGGSATIQLDDPETFDDVYRRLYGDSFFREDRVVQCEELNHLYQLFSPEAFQHLSAIARGQIPYNAPLDTLQRGSPDDPHIHLTIDVDQNPIAILYKVQFIIRALRTARAKAGKADPIEGRVAQQLQTLEEKLDKDIVGDGERRDFRQDDEVFRVWDLAQTGKTHDEITQIVWPHEREQDQGVRDVAGDRTRIGQRVYKYYKRAEEWIDLFTGRIKDDTVTVR